MVYTVFPNLDVIKAVMLTNAFCLLPGILGTFSRGFEKLWGIKCAVDVIAIFCQLSALFVWPLIEPHKSTKNHWTLPVSAILISFGWWENFIDESSPFPPMKFLAKMKTKLRRTRYFTYTFISIWKMAVFLLMLTVGTKVNENSWSIAFDLFHEGFDNHTIPVQEVTFITFGNHTHYSEWNLDWLHIHTWLIKTKTRFKWLPDSRTNWGSGTFHQCLIPWSNYSICSKPRERCFVDARIPNGSYLHLLHIRKAGLPHMHPSLQLCIPSPFVGPCNTNSYN